MVVGLATHWRYFRYVARHKWCVLLECWRLGIPWLGVWHDISKFNPDEWIPYANFFYGSKGESVQREVAMDWAWLLHQKRNRHHWQWYILPGDDGKTKILEIPLYYCKEMLADWRGAGRALGTPDTLAWYNKNKENMLLGPQTRIWIETQLDYQNPN